MDRKKYMSKLRIEMIDDYNCLVDSDIIKLRSMGGCRRKGFYGDQIIKFDNDYELIPSQNLREIELWKLIEKKDRKHFAAINQYSYKDEYIVQERIKFKRGRKSRKHYDVIFDLIEKYEIGDIGFCGENDNWGVRDNDVPVIFDYGFVSDY